MTERHSHSLPIAVSSDAVGILTAHHVDLLKEAYRDTSLWHEPMPLELLAWGDRWGFITQMLINRAQRTGFEVVGLHARTGGIHEAYDFKHRTVLWGLNRLITPSQKVYERGQANHISYVLIHAPETRNGIPAPVPKHPYQPILVAENHIRSGAVGYTLEQIQTLFHLSAQHQKLGIMFDLFHFDNALAKLQPDQTRRLHHLAAYISQQCQDLRRDTSPDIFIGFHLPLGIDPHDSFNMSHLNHPEHIAILQHLIHLVGPHILVIENQQGFPHNLYLTKEHLESLKARNHHLAEFVAQITSPL